MTWTDRKLMPVFNYRSFCWCAFFTFGHKKIFMDYVNVSLWCVGCKPNIWKKLFEPSSRSEESLIFRSQKCASMWSLTVSKNSQLLIWDIIDVGITNAYFPKKDIQSLCGKLLVREIWPFKGGNLTVNYKYLSSSSYQKGLPTQKPEAAIFTKSRIQLIMGFAPYMCATGNFSRTKCYVSVEQFFSHILKQMCTNQSIAIIVIRFKPSWPSSSWFVEINS